MGPFWSITCISCWQAKHSMVAALVHGSPCKPHPCHHCYFMPTVQGEEWWMTEVSWHQLTKAFCLSCCLMPIVSVFLVFPLNCECPLQYSVQLLKSCPTLCDPMNHSMPGLCPSQTPGVYSNSCPSSQWCHPAILPSVVPFSSCPQSLPAPGSFPMSQLFAWGGQSTGVSASASVLSVNTQDWSPLGWTGWV